MVLNCKLCSSEDYVFSGYLCSTCSKIQDIIKIYGAEKITESLEYIFVRGSQPIKNRTDVVATADSMYLYSNVKDDKDKDKDKDKKSKL
tara:strand:- start:292 stop:558 length:267 start_codon:yes stop_codon:yes gene_type:complete